MHSKFETAESKAVRMRRQAMRRKQGVDILAERARLIAYWRKCTETNTAYYPHTGAWWDVFTWNPAFRHLLMPTLRARQDARALEQRQLYAAELREASRLWAQAKAERNAAKARAALPQLDLLDRMESVK